MARGRDPGKSLWVETERVTWAAARQAALEVPTIVGFGPNAYRDLAAELGEAGLVQHLAALATEAGKPVVISLADGQGGVFTTAVAPQGWSEAQLRQAVTPLMPHFEEQYGPAPEGPQPPEYWAARLRDQA